MRVNPTFILQELDRRRKVHIKWDEQARENEARVEAEWQKRVDAYKVLPWWKKLFWPAPSVSHYGWSLYTDRANNVSEFDAKHRNIYALCQYAEWKSDFVELPFEYSYLLKP